MYGKGIALSIDWIWIKERLLFYILSVYELDMTLIRDEYGLSEHWICIVG